MFSKETKVKNDISKHELIFQEEKNVASEVYDLDTLSSNGSISETVDTFYLNPNNNNKTIKTIQNNFIKSIDISQNTEINKNNKNISPTSESRKKLLFINNQTSSNAKNQNFENNVPDNNENDNDFNYNFNNENSDEIAILSIESNINEDAIIANTSIFLNKNNNNTDTFSKSNKNLNFNVNNNDIVYANNNENNNYNTGNENENDQDEEDKKNLKTEELTTVTTTSTTTAIATTTIMNNDIETTGSSTITKKNRQKMSERYHVHHATLKLPSPGLMQYEEYLSAEQSTNKFYVGKRQTNSNNKFSLNNNNTHNNNNNNNTKEKQDLIKLLEKDRLSVAEKKMYTDLELFKNLFPTSSTLQKKQVELHSLDATVQNNLKFYDTILNTSIINNDKNNNKYYNSKKNEIYYDDTMKINDNYSNNNNNINNNKNNINDEKALHEWKDYTIEKILKEKYSIKKTLPVLVASAKTVLNNNNKKTVFSKAKRYSSGALVETSDEIPFIYTKQFYTDSNDKDTRTQDDNIINTKPTIITTTSTASSAAYLNAYNNTFKVHTTAEDRKKAIEAIHLITNDKKSFL